MTRRALSLAALVALGACVHGAPSLLADAERPSGIVRFQAGGVAPAVLRQKAAPLRADDPALPALVEALRAELERQGGVGLAAPQVGVSRRVVLVKLNTRPRGEVRVDALVNPIIEQPSPETDLDYEACLSVEGGGGLVRRHVRITLSWEPVGGGPRVYRELSGWDARIAQHEVDHLDGVLFIDRLEGPLLPMDEMRQRRDEEHRRRGWLPPAPDS
jgi:peptide deformylase